MPVYKNFNMAPGDFNQHRFTSTLKVFAEYLFAILTFPVWEYNSFDCFPQWNPLIHLNAKEKAPMVVALDSELPSVADFLNGFSITSTITGCNYIHCLQPLRP